MSQRRRQLLHIKVLINLDKCKHFKHQCFMQAYIRLRGRVG